MQTDVYIYCRAATQGENSEKSHNSLEGQEAECRAFCAKMGLQIKEVYREVCSGARYPAQLQNIREGLLGGNADHLVVTSLDRITRDATLLDAFLKEMNSYRISVITTTNGHALILPDRLLVRRHYLHR